MEIVTQYNYLGLLVTERVDYKVTASMIAKSTARALGLLKTNSKANGPLGMFSCISAIQHYRQQQTLIILSSHLTTA